MANNVDITLAANSREAEKAYQRLNSENDRLARKLEDVQNKSKRSVRDTASGLEKNVQMTKQWAIALTGVTSGLSAVQLAARLVGEEWANTQRKQEARRLASLGPAAAIRDARYNMTEDDTIKDKDLEGLVAQIAKETRSDQSVVASVLSGAFSAKGSLSNKVAADAVRQALRIKPNDAEQGSVLAGRFLDVAKFSKTDNIKAIAGFEANIQQAARVKDPAKVGANLIPAIGGATHFGDTPEQAAEMLSAVTQILNDERGELSRTAFLQLGGQLKSFVPKRAEKGKNKGRLIGKDARGSFEIPENQFDDFEKAKNTEERLAVIRQSPELQREFVGSASFEQATRQQMLSIIRGDEVALTEIAKASETIRAIGKEQEKLFEQKMKKMEGGTLQRMLTADQQSAANLQDIDLEPGLDHDKAVARQILRDTFEGKDGATGINLPGIDALSRKLRMEIFEHKLRKGDNPFESAIGILNATRQELASKEFNPFKGKFVPRATGTPEDFKKIDSQIKLLEQQQGVSAESGPLGVSVGGALGAYLQTINKGTDQAATTSQQRDPDMIENNRILQQVSSTLDRIERQNNSPLIRRPDATRLSRGYEE